MSRSVESEMKRTRTSGARRTWRWSVVRGAIRMALAVGVLGSVSCVSGPAPAAAPGPTGFAPAPEPPAELVIQDVRLFDGEVVHEGATVVVRDGRIAEAGPGVSVPAAAEVIDGAGRTLLPGLIDAHTHTFADALLEYSLAFGVTTVIDMFTEPTMAGAWREEQEAGGATDRADIISAGVLATVEGGHGTQYGGGIPTVESPAAADAFVAERVEQGSAFLKIVIEDGSVHGLELSTLDAPRVRALVEAADARGLMPVAHVARLRDARMALDAGVDGLVHLWVDRTPDAELVEDMAEAGMFVIPTLTVLEGTTGVASGASLLTDDRIAPFLDPDIAGNLEQSFPRNANAVSSFDSALVSLAALHAAGVPVLAGSDAPNPGTTHGASVHRELELLVQAGLSPVEALRAATSVPADAFGLEDRGRIAPGLRADLVLVEGDPTADILATRAIAGVWKGGEAYDRGALAERLAAQRTRRTEAASGPAQGAALISDFEGGELTAEFGAGWSETTDAMMGGSSTVDVAVEAAESGMALRVTGETKSGTPFPWSGVMFAPGSTQMAPVDLSGSEGVSFRARGDGTSYQVLLFHESGGFAPVVVQFEAGPEWAEHTIAWSEFNGADGTGVMGIAFVAGAPPRTFELWLDDIALR